MNLMEAGKDSLYLAVSKAYDATGVVSGCLKCRLLPPLPNKLQGSNAGFSRLLCLSVASVCLPGCDADLTPPLCCWVNAIRQTTQVAVRMITAFSVQARCVGTLARAMLAHRTQSLTALSLSTAEVASFMVCCAMCHPSVQCEQVQE